MCWRLRPHFLSQGFQSKIFYFMQFTHESFWLFPFDALLLFFFFHFKTFSEQILVFQNIASHYNMRFLEETIDWLLVMSPQIGQNTHQMWDGPPTLPARVISTQMKHLQENCVQTVDVWALDFIALKLCMILIWKVNKWWMPILFHVFESLSFYCCMSMWVAPMRDLPNVFHLETAFFSVIYSSVELVELLVPQVVTIRCLIDTRLLALLSMANGHRL